MTPAEAVAKLKECLPGAEDVTCDVRANRLTFEVGNGCVGVDSWTINHVQAAFGARSVEFKFDLGDPYAHYPTAMFHIYMELR